MRRRAKVDANQGEIVEAARAAGASVLSLAQLHGGCRICSSAIRRDNVVGSQADRKATLTPMEALWTEHWRARRWCAWRRWRRRWRFSGALYEPVSDAVPARLRDRRGETSMIVVYIAGPFRADSAWGIEQNVRRAEELALSHGAPDMLCSVRTRTRASFRRSARRHLAPWDMELLRRCDALLLTDTWSVRLARGPKPLKRGAAIFQSSPHWMNYWPSSLHARRRHRHGARAAVVVRCPNRAAVAS